MQLATVVALNTGIDAVWSRGRPVIRRTRVPELDLQDLALDFCAADVLNCRGVTARERSQWADGAS